MLAGEGWGEGGAYVADLIIFNASLFAGKGVI
jgi:hypothetical protein